MVFGRNQFFASCWTESLSFSQVVPEETLSSFRWTFAKCQLALWNRETWEGNTESQLSWWKSVFCNLIIKWHPSTFTISYWLESRCQVQPTLKERGLYKSWNAGKLSYGGKNWPKVPIQPEIMLFVMSGALINLPEAYHWGYHYTASWKHRRLSCLQLFKIRPQSSVPTFLVFVFCLFVCLPLLMNSML